MNELKLSSNTSTCKTGKIEMYTGSPFWLKYQIPDCVISKCVGKRASCGYAFFIQRTRIRKSAIVSKS